MKKIAAILLCIVLICAFAAPAYAAGASVSVSASKTTLYRGDEVTVTLSFSASENIRTASAKLVYDSSVFEIVSGTVNTSAGTLLHNFNGQGFVLQWSTEGQYSTQLGTVVLRVKDDAKIGSTTISSTPSFKNGTVTVAASSSSVTVNITCEHSWSAWSKADDTNHTRSCSKCTTSETVAHDWDNGKVTTAATCAKEGVKTYTCQTTGCGATKTEAIEKLKSHNWGDWTKLDNDQHKRTCKTCGENVVETGDHSWDAGKITKPATCAAPGEKTFTCSVCKGTKVEPTSPDEGHTWGKWEKHNETEHINTCTVCGKATKTEDHKWNSGTVTKAATCKEEGVRTKACTECGQTKTESIPKPTEHDWDKWVKESDTKHKHTCKVCGDTVFESADHTWNDGTVTKAPTCKEEGIETITCTGCGAEKTKAIEKLKEHAWGKWTEVDATSHKRICTVCGDSVSETAKHGETTKWTSDGNQHWHECADCKAKLEAAKHTHGAAATETTAQRCTVCNRILVPAKGHTHKWDTKYTTDASSHWYACSGCNDKKDEKAHDFENDCDGLCETCQYTRETTHKFGTEWSSDETGHFHACTVCGEKTDLAEHAPGVEATETTAQTCTACNFELAPALGHTHVFSEVWEKDEVNHWHVCACGEKADEAAHEWNDQGLCPICLAEKPAEEAPAEGGFPWWIIIVAVVVVGGVVVLIVVGKKKKK